MSTEPLFTAAEIAAPLNCSSQYVRKVIGKTNVVAGQKIVRGVAAAAWPFCALPIEFQTNLTAKAEAGFFRDATHLLEGKSRQWAPQIPYAEIHPDCIAAAQARQEFLAPILQRHHQERTAEIVRIALLERVTPFGSPKTLRQWIEIVKERDFGRLEFSKPELYLDKNLREKGQSRPEKSRFDGPLAAALLSVRDVLNPTGAERAKIWDAAFCELCMDRNAGLDPKLIKSRLVDLIEASPVVMVKSRTAGESERPALNIQFDRKWERWAHAGWKGGIQALEDHRKNNPGAKPLAVLNGEELELAQKLYTQTRSKTAALRMLARSEKCRPEVAEAILRKRSTRHTLTKALREQISATPGAKA